VAAAGVLELDEEELAIARVLTRLVGDAERRRNVRGVAVQAPRFRLTELRRQLLKDRVFGDPTRLLLRLKRRGLLDDAPEGRTDRVYRVDYPDELQRTLLGEIARSDAPDPAALLPVPDEDAEIRAMDADFLDALREVMVHRLDATIEFGRSFNATRLGSYLRSLFGEELYLDALIALLQQYALADVPLVAPTGRTTGSTGFHLALFGPPGTGKTFSIDDMIRGNPKTGVPPHGLPGRNR
jgi:hypothetical protein